MIDQSQTPLSPVMQNQQADGAPQQQSNQLGGLIGNPAQASPQQQNITKQQVIAGLHHLNAFTKQFAPLLSNPATGKTNIRPKIFDASATLIGAGIFTVPEVINGIKDLPDDPVEQKKWLEMKLANTAMAEKKLISDYIAQGPGPEQDGQPWSTDNHKEHMTGLMGNYRAR